MWSEREGVCGVSARVSVGVRVRMRNGDQGHPELVLGFGDAFLLRSLRTCVLQLHESARVERSGADLHTIT